MPAKPKLSRKCELLHASVAGRERCRFQLLSPPSLTRGQDEGADVAPALATCHLLLGDATAALSLLQQDELAQQAQRGASQRHSGGGYGSGSPGSGRGPDARHGVMQFVRDRSPEVQPCLPLPLLPGCAGSPPPLLLPPPPASCRESQHEPKLRTGKHRWQAPRHTRPPHPSRACWTCGRGWPPLPAGGWARWPTPSSQARVRPVRPGL